MTADDHRFPILCSGLPRGTTCPRSVPWSFVAPHEERARLNHDQSLVRLAARGGLDPVELWAVVHDVGYFEAPSLDEALAWLVDAGHG